MVNALDNLLICGCILEKYRAGMNEFILLIRVLFLPPPPIFFFQTHIFLFSLPSNICHMIFPGNSYSFPPDSFHESIWFLYGSFFLLEFIDSGAAYGGRNRNEFFFQLSWAEGVFFPSCPGSAYLWPGYIIFLISGIFSCVDRDDVGFHSIHLCKSLHYLTHGRSSLPPRFRLLISCYSKMFRIFLSWFITPFQLLVIV